MSTRQARKQHYLFLKNYVHKRQWAQEKEKYLNLLFKNRPKKSHIKKKVKFLLFQLDALQIVGMGENNPYTKSHRRQRKVQNKHSSLQEGVGWTSL